MKLADVINENYLIEFDRSDFDLVRDIGGKNDRKAQAHKDDTATRDDFRDKMRNREGQSIQAGDRVFNPRSDKMFVVQKITDQGILFKGASKPTKVNVTATGRTTNLGHRVFTIR